MNNFLKYGDLVVFYQGSSGGGSKKDRVEETPLLGPYGGVMSCLGYTDPGLYMQELPKPRDEDSVKLSSDLNLLGLRDAVFTITPRLSYDFHKDYKKNLQYFKSLEATLKNTKNLEKQELLRLRDNLKTRLLKLEERTKKEEQLNLSIVRESAGKPVQFGAEVQLMHFDSNCFLKATNQCSQTETIGYTCELSSFYSSGMVFKISPKYRSRQDGDAIQLRDNVIFQSVKHKAFLTVSKEIPIYADNSNSPETNPFLVNSNVLEPRCRRLRMFLSQENETSFQVVLYRNQHPDAHLYLLGGDIVKLTHTEIQADLTTTISHFADKPNSNTEVYMRQYEGEYKEEHSALHSYWFIEHLNFEEAGEKFGIMENQSQSKNTASVRLRNLVTGGVLDKFAIEGSADYRLACVGNLTKSDNFSNFDLEPVVKNCEYLLNNQIYFLTEKETGFFLKYDKTNRLERNNEELLKRLKSRDSNYMFYPLEVSDLSEVNYPAKLNREFSSEDAYIVHKIPETEKKEILFVRSVIPTLKYMKNLFDKKSDNIDSDTYNLIIRSLKLIISFLFNLDESSEVDYFEIEDMPSQRKQKMLKDIGFVDALVHIIYLPFSRGLYNFRNFTLADNFGKMLEMSYTSIRYAIKEYRPSELYASQWIHLMMEQALQTGGDTDIRAGQTLTELIDNNQRILESRIELSTINRFIDILRDKDKDAKYVDILRAICICDGSPMIKNQRDITKQLVESPANKEQLIFGVVNDHVYGVLVRLKVKNFENVELRKLEEESKAADDGKTFDYVISMIRLFSDLCKGRNYLCIEVMQKEFTYDICFEVVSNEKYGYKIREAFAVFMVNLWIDVSPLQRLELPFYVKVWDSAGDMGQKIKDQTSVMRHEKLKFFLFDYLDNFKRKAEDAEQEDDKASFDLAILELTETLLSLGLIQEIPEINKILASLKNYLSNSDDALNEAKKPLTQDTFSRSMTLMQINIKTDNEKKPQGTSKVEFSEIEVPQKIVQCKQKICDILLFGLMVMNEHRVENFLAEYRQLLEKLEKEPTAAIPSSKLAIPSEELMPGQGENLRSKSKYFSEMDDIVRTVNQRTSKIELGRSEGLFKVLIELVNYKDHGLKTSAVKLLTQLFHQTQLLGETVYSLQMVDELKGKEAFIQARKHSLFLDEKGDLIEKWYDNDESPEIAELVVVLNKLYESLLNLKTQNAYELDKERMEAISPQDRTAARFMMSDQLNQRRSRPTKTVLNLKSEGNLPDIHQFLIDSYEEKVDSFQQDLFRNTGIFRSLLTMVLYDVETESSSERKESSVILMKKIYRILAKGCKENEKNKETVGKYLDTVVLKHFQQKEHDLNTTFLIKEMVTNNRTLLLNEVKIKKLINILCQSLESLPNTDIKKSYTMTILSQLVKYKEFILSKNQNAILSAIISKEFANIRPKTDSQELENDLSQLARNKMLQRNIKLINNDKVKVLVIPTQVTYFIAYISVLTSCAEGKNAFSENICQNLISLETLYKLVYVGDYCIVLKYALLEYFYHVYLDTERDIPFHILEVFLSIVKNLLDQFEFYSKKKYQENDDNVENNEDFMILLSDSYIHFSKWVEDYLLLLIKCFVNVVRRNLNLIADSEPARDYEKHILSLVDFVQIALEKFQNETISSRLVKLVREIYSKNMTGPIADKIKEKHRSIIDGKRETNEMPGGNTTERKKRKTTIMGRLQTLTPGGNSTFRKYEAIVEGYFRSDKFDYLCNEEFTQLVKQLTVFDTTSSVESQYISLDLFFQSLMSYLSPTNEHPEEDIYLRTMRIFRRYLEFTGTHLAYKPMIDWEVSQWKNFQAAVEPQQNRLVGLGLIKMICEVIQNMDSNAIIQETMLLATSLLFGGNSAAQQAFLEDFTKDEDSLVLDKLRSQLSDAFEVVKKNMREQNSLSLRLFYVKFDSNISQREAHEAEIEEGRNLLSIRKEIERVEEKYSLCKYIFKFLQLLCEGHNKDLQNLLRQQNAESAASTQNSINFIALTANFWGSYTKFVNPACVDLGSLILSFIVESVQGPCELNQREFYQHKVVDFSKDFMNDFCSDRDFDCRGFKGFDKEQLHALITKNIIMLDSILEANQDKAIYEYIGHNIDPAYLIKKLTSQFQEIFSHVDLLKHSHGGKIISADIFRKFVKFETFEEEFSEAFQIFFFIQNIEENTGLYKKVLKELKPQQKLAYDFFLQNSGHIELIFQGNIQRIYFMIHPICRFLDDNQKKLFLDNVKRDTPNEKITDFLTQAPSMFDRMDHISILNSRISFFSEGTLSFVRDVCFFIILCINLYIFFTFRKRVDHMSYVTESNDYSNLILFILGVAHIVTSSFMIFLWLFLNAKLVLMEGWRERFNRYKKMLPTLFHSVKSTSEYQNIQAIMNKKQIRMTKSDITQTIRFFSVNSRHPYPLPTIEYYIQNCLFVLSNSTLRFLIFYTAVSVLAFVGKLYFLYSIHLLDIINRFDTLSNVIKAITHNKSQLLLTAFLAIILLYFYSLFAFTYVDDTFFMAAVEPAGENMCHTLLQCFTVVAALGPRSSGSVGDVLLRPTYAHEHRIRYYIRWIYDVSIFFIVNIICMKLIFGIIIDTFAQLRDKKYQIDYDKNNVCFICSLDRYLFDKNADGFENHIRRDHNVWSYLYFMYILKRKDPTEFNGIESYVFKRILLEDISWIPLKNSLSLKKFDGEKDNLEAKFQQVQEEIDKIEEKFSLLKKSQS